MVLFLGFNLAETTLAKPPRGRSEVQQEPNAANDPVVEAECEENPAQWKWQEAQHAGNQDSKNKLGKKVTQFSSRRSLVGVGSPHPYGWKDIWLIKS